METVQRQGGRLCRWLSCPAVGQGALAVSPSGYLAGTHRTEELAPGWLGPTGGPGTWKLGIRH